MRVDTDDYTALVTEAFDNAVTSEPPKTPRQWAEAFHSKYGGGRVPDVTILYGWFACAMRGEPIDINAAQPAEETNDVHSE